MNNSAGQLQSKAVAKLCLLVVLPNKTQLLLFKVIFPLAGWSQNFLSL